MLDGPMAGVEEIVFAVRTSVRRHYYENFGFGIVPGDQYPLPEPGSAAPGVPLFGKGGRLCRLNLRSGKVVASFSPGHGRWEHTAYVAVVDPDLGPDARHRARTVNHKRMSRDPYPFSEDCFLVADEEGIWVMDGSGLHGAARRPGLPRDARGHSRGGRAA